MIHIVTDQHWTTPILFLEFEYLYSLQETTYILMEKFWRKVDLRHELFSPPNDSLDGVLLYRCGGGGGGVGGVGGGGGRFLEMALPVVL